jgi:hypothetical protein
MQFKDISTGKKTSYVLKENEKVVFFLQNRSGTFDFVLAGTGTEAHVFALFDKKESVAFSLEIRQHHTAPNTKSTALVKSLLSGIRPSPIRGSSASRKAQPNPTRNRKTATSFSPKRRPRSRSPRLRFSRATWSASTQARPARSPKKPSST